jgi:hypothetical protein
VWDVTLGAAGPSSEVSVAIGLVSVVLGAAAGQWWGAWREQRNMGWQARDSWLREIRDVLDDAARAVTEAVYAFDRRWSERGGAERDQLGVDAYARLMEAEVAGNRISTRLGANSEASQRWQEVLSKLRRLSELVYEQGGQTEPSEEDRNRWKLARDHAANARDSFFRSAEAWIDEREWQLPGRPRLKATGDERDG